jgi:osmotically-inducible protein OsmY
MTTFSKRISAFLFALLMLSLAGCAATTTKEGTGGYVDDTVITTKVKAEIFNEPTLKSAEINVETFKGVVQLSGFVTQRDDAAKAAAVAANVSGVQSVKNNILLK